MQHIATDYCASGKHACCDNVQLLGERFLNYSHWQPTSGDRHAIILKKRHIYHSIINMTMAEG
jgi:hypothetical protein